MPQKENRRSRDRQAGKTLIEKGKAGKRPAFFLINNRLEGMP